VKLFLNKWVKTLISSSLFALVPVAIAHAQDAKSQAPAKPPFNQSTMIIGFAPGGAIDTTGRIVADAISSQTGIPVVVVNRPGAGGNVAHQNLAASGPFDGSTIILSSVGALTVSPHLTKLNYDPKKDFIPISMAVNFPNVLVVPSSLNIKTFEEFVDYARQNPGKVNFASSGIGSASHMAGELLSDMAGVQMVHVPYKGGAPALTDVIAGRVDSYFATPSSSRPHLDSGKLVALATSGLSRSSQFPDIPAISEFYPGFNATNWYAFMAPKGTPKQVLDWWQENIVQALNSDNVKKRLLAAGLEPSPSSPEELAKSIDSEYETWGKIIKERGITATE